MVTSAHSWLQVVTCPWVAVLWGASGTGSTLSCCHLYIRGYCILTVDVCHSSVFFPQSLHIGSSLMLHLCRFFGLDRLSMDSPQQEEDPKWQRASIAMPASSSGDPILSRLPGILPPLLSLLWVHSCLPELWFSSPFPHFWKWVVPGLSLRFPSTWASAIEASHFHPDLVFTPLRIPDLDVLWAPRGHSDPVTCKRKML